MINLWPGGVIHPLVLQFYAPAISALPAPGSCQIDQAGVSIPADCRPPRAAPNCRPGPPPKNEVLEGPHKVIHHAPLSEQSGRKPSFRFKCVCRAKLWGAFQIATDTLVRSSQVTIRSPSGGAFFVLQKIYIKASVRFRQRATVVLGWCPGPDDGSLAET